MGSVPNYVVISLSGLGVIMVAVPFVSHLRSAVVPGDVVIVRGLGWFLNGVSLG